MASASTRVGVLDADVRLGVADPATRVAVVVLGVDEVVAEATGVASAVTVGMSTAAGAATTGSERSGTGLDEVAAWSAQAAAEVLATIVAAATMRAIEVAPLSSVPRQRMPQG